MSNALHAPRLQVGTHLRDIDSDVCAATTILFRLADANDAHAVAL